MNTRQSARRAFLAASGGTLLAGLVPWRDALAATAAPAAPHLPPLSAEAARVYRHAFVFDANNMAAIGDLLEEKDCSQRLRMLKTSGMSALKTTLGGAQGRFDQAVADIAGVQAMVDTHPDLFIKVVRPEDLEHAKHMGKIALVCSFEAVTMLQGRIERIEEFRRLDVLVMQLAYNHRSAFGCGCLDGDADGITALGRKAVARMNALGVALDLSHANTQTTLDGIRLSRRPSVITHAGCRAVYNHPRNKTDGAMRALADKGGVMGIYMLPFLTPPTRQPVLADYMRHMLHALKVCGEDHVGIGTDSLFFPPDAHTLRAIAQLEARRRKEGVGAPGENRPPYLPDVDTTRKLAWVTDALLRHGYSERVADKVLGLNFRRVFKQIWTV
jgi:membrane dipeptidase